MATTFPRNTMLTADDYDVIKALLKAGLYGSKITDITGRGSSTISRIGSSDSFEDYKTKLRAVNRASHDRVAARKAAEAEVEAETAKIMNQLEAFDEPAKVDAKDFTGGEPTQEEWIGANEVMIRSSASREDYTLERIANALERLANAWEAAPTKKGLFK